MKSKFKVGEIVFIEWPGDYWGGYRRINQIFNSGAVSVTVPDDGNTGAFDLKDIRKLTKKEKLKVFIEEL